MNAPLAAPIATGLTAVLTAIEDRIAAAGLTPRALPVELQTLRGAHGDAPLQLHTRRWRGPGLAALTVATILDPTGGLATVTIIGLPAPGQPAPILGVDLIGLGGALSLVAVDLAPTDRDAWVTHAEPLLASLHGAVAEHVVIRRRPSFTDEVFSPRALIAGVRRGAETPVLAAIADFIPCATELLLRPAPAHTPDDRVAAWCRAELQNRREHDALTRLFGAPSATAYLDLLFGAGATT